MSPDAPTSPAEAETDTLRVELGERGYDIVAGSGVIARAAIYVRPLLKHPRLVVITDENVAERWLEPLADDLAREGIACERIVLPPGESTKDFARFQDLAERLLGLGIDRSTMLAALGGGVIGDLAGFAAATVLRGIDFVQIPTTLLAQVDSSVGGKTGINSRHGKNLVGAFHQPRLVLADMAALDTLPRRELGAGYAEVVKYGVIGDAGFFAWLEENGADLLAGDAGLRRHAVVESCRAKALVVAEDERESGRRALLNLGHTFGHALEAETGYGETLLHGESVAIGMVMALDLSVRLGLAPAEDLDRLKAHLAACGLPTGLAGLVRGDWTADRLLGHMAKDKKTEAGQLTFILARGIGEAFIAKDVPAERVREVLDAFLADADRG